MPTIPYDRDDDMMAATLRDQQTRLRAIRFDEVAVVIGRGGHQDRELHTENIAADNIPLYKRPGGGCSVVLDPRNVIISLTLPLAGVGHIKSTFEAITVWLIASLAAAGIPDVVSRGVSDLVLHNRKVGGSCVYRTRGLLYYSTTLLWDPDLNLVQKYLQHPPREPGYRAGRPHQDFMGRLTSYSGGTIYDFLDAIVVSSTHGSHLPLAKLTLC